MPRIKELYAIISYDTDEDDEGLMAYSVGDLMMPLVGADWARIESLIPAADNIAKLAGKRYKIVRFTNMKEIHIPKGELKQ